jgi:hypothetical protein
VKDVSDWVILLAIFFTKCGLVWESCRYEWKLMYEIKGTNYVSLMLIMRVEHNMIMSMLS